MLGAAEVMVNSVIGLADRLGMAHGFAGLTLVGIGTSAPLIATSVQGARRGEHYLVVGNVLGGNLFIALGGGALVGLLFGGPALGSGLVPLVLMVGVVTVSWLAMARGGAANSLGGPRPAHCACGMLPFPQPLSVARAPGTRPSPPSAGQSRYVGSSQRASRSHPRPEGVLANGALMLTDCL